MTKSPVASLFWNASSTPIVLSILFCRFSILFEEPETLPDSNSNFFEGSLNKSFFFSKKDQHHERVLRTLVPRMMISHTVNILRGHYTEEMVRLTVSNNVYTLTQRYTYEEKKVKFRIGVEFDEESITQEEFKSVVMQDRDRLIHTQYRPHRKPSTVVTTRWFSPDRLVVVMEVPEKNLTTRMVYRPAEREDSRFRVLPKKCRC